jgi:hypothetical protein
MATVEAEHITKEAIKVAEDKKKQKLAVAKPKVQEKVAGRDREKRSAPAPHYLNGLVESTQNKAAIHVR